MGPLRWEVVEPLRRWRLSLAPNETGVEFELDWLCRARAYETRRYEVRDEHGASNHAHFFQSGRYDGVLSIDGRSVDVAGWYGQRDRSRGQRRVRDRLGMHLWVQAQLPGASIGLLFNCDRHGATTHCDGALMREDGAVDPVTGVRHALDFDDGLEFRSGELELELESGERHRVGVESTGPGIYMAGGGHAGWHGIDHGPGHAEHDRWPLDGTMTPRELPISLAQAVARYSDGRQSGTGVFEYALTRSPSFVYSPTLVS